MRLLTCPSPSDHWIPILSRCRHISSASGMRRSMLISPTNLTGPGSISLTLSTGAPQRQPWPSDIPHIPRPALDLLRRNTSTSSTRILPLQTRPHRGLAITSNTADGAHWSYEAGHTHLTRTRLANIRLRPSAPLPHHNRYSGKGRIADTQSRPSRSQQLALRYRIRRLHP